MGGFNTRIQASLSNSNVSLGEIMRCFCSNYASISALLGPGFAVNQQSSDLMSIGLIFIPVFRKSRSIKVVKRFHSKSQTAK